MRFKATGSLLESKEHREDGLLRKHGTKMVLDWRHLPENHWHDLHRKSESQSSSSGNATKLLHLCPCTTTVVHKLYNVDHVVKLNFVNQYLHAVYAQEINPTLLFSNKVWFHFSGHVNSHQNNRHRSM